MKPTFQEGYHFHDGTPCRDNHDKVIVLDALDKRPPCSRIGTKRFNPDGTENWCSRNFPGTCPECGLNAYLD